MGRDQNGRGEAAVGPGDSVRACKTCALGAPRARTLGARQNAKACQEAWMRLVVNRFRLVEARRLVDMLVSQSKQVQCAK